MGAAKPCLGYPSRTAAVLGLRQQGLNTGQIAQAIGIKPQTVTALECGSSRPQRERSDYQYLGRAVLVPTDVLDALGPHAAKRGISVNNLARLIVSTVVDEGMIDAVLDDGAEWGQA
jgi:transcriptional regulator with XRE-family HTH domain